MPPDPRQSRASVGEIEGLRDGLWARGVARVLLAGAGGIGVAAEVLAGAGARLTVLDGCDPVQLAEAVAGDLASTVLVVSAPPGADTTAVELVWDEVAAAQTTEGLDPAAHTVLVAPPGSPLAGRAGGAPVVPGPIDLAYPVTSSHRAEPVRGQRGMCEVGAWAALTPYALVPAGLAGAEVGALVGDALGRSATGPASPSAWTGTDGTSATVPDGTDIAGRLGDLGLGDLGLGDLTGHVALSGPLAEVLAQLLAALPGPRPLVVEEAGAPGWDTAVLTVGGPKADLPAEGPVAAELLAWQHAVALLHAGPEAGMSGIPQLGVPQRPTRGLAVRESGAEVHRVGTSGTSFVEIRAPWPVASLPEALARLVDGASSLAVHAHLDRHDDASAALLRTELSARTGIVTAFGWGARTTPRAHAVLQITGAGPDGVTAAHQQAVADADAEVLEHRGVRVLRLHLHDRLIGLVELVRAVQELPELQ